MQIVAIVLLIAATQCSMAASKRVWMRRATLAASCAANLLFDTVTTQRHIAAGGIERNVFFADSQGNPRWGRMISLKAGICAASTAIQETAVFGAWRGRRADWTWTGVNLATTSLYTWAGMHNLGLIEDSQFRAAQTQRVPDH